jgi:hypothetical protein
MTRAVGVQIQHRFFLFVVTLLALFAVIPSRRVDGESVLDTADRLLGYPGERLASPDERGFDIISSLNRWRVLCVRTDGGRMLRRHA